MIKHTINNNFHSSFVDFLNQFEEEFIGRSPFPGSGIIRRFGCYQYFIAGGVGAEPETDRRGGVEVQRSPVGPSLVGVAGRIGRIVGQDNEGLGMKEPAERIAQEAAAYERDILVSMDRSVLERKGMKMLPIFPDRF